MTLQEKREARAKALADARAIHEKSVAEKREMTAEENGSYDKAITAFRDLGKEIDAELKKVTKEQRSAELDAAEREMEQSAGRRTDPPSPNPDEGRQHDARERTILEIRGRKYAFERGSDVHKRCQPKYVDAYRSWLRGETRALQSDLDTAGGYLITPEKFMPELIKNLDDEVFMRGLARKFAVPDAAAMGSAKRASKAATFNWGAELTAPTQDSSLKFGKRSITPHYMSGEILVSNDLLRMAVMDPETIVNEELARDAGELEEQAFMTGSGAQQPLGVFTASTDGISTARDVQTGSATDLTADAILTAKYTLKKMYRKSAQWLWHRDSIAKLAKLKDTTNQYLWLASIRDNEPDRLAGLPFNESEWVPNTYTTGKYVGLLGDFRFYWIVDGLSLQLQRLVEKYAETNQVAFLVRRKVDGAPVVEEAFVRLKTN